jgi:uncharacterized protein YndB with AHSA1/START domain
MTNLRNTVTIAASPDAVWSVLGDLGATDEWLPGTVSARVDGSQRVCAMADGSEVREEIVELSPERRRYRFRHLQVPLPVEESSGTFAVEQDGAGAVVVLESEFRPLDPAVPGMYDAALKQALESLRRRVEEGKRWNE